MTDQLNTFEISGTVPSVNHYMRHTRHGAFMTEAGKQFKHDLGWMFKSFFPSFEMRNDKEYFFDIQIHLRKHTKDGKIHKVNNRRNIDNCLKVLLDALEGIVYEDDLQVTKITVEKFLGDDDRVVIGFRERWWEREIPTNAL